MYMCALSTDNFRYAIVRRCTGRHHEYCITILPSRMLRPMLTRGIRPAISKALNLDLEGTNAPTRCKVDKVLTAVQRVYSIADVWLMVDVRDAVTSNTPQAEYTNPLPCSLQLTTDLEFVLLPWWDIAQAPRHIPEDKSFWILYTYLTLWCQFDHLVLFETYLEIIIAHGDIDGSRIGGGFREVK